MTSRWIQTPPYSSILINSSTSNATELEPSPMKPARRAHHSGAVFSAITCLSAQLIPSAKTRCSSRPCSCHIAVQASGTPLVRGHWPWRDVTDRWRWFSAFFGEGGGCLFLGLIRQLEPIRTVRFVDNCRQSSDVRLVSPSEDYRSSWGPSKRWFCLFCDWTATSVF